MLAASLGPHLVRRRIGPFEGIIRHGGTPSSVVSGQRAVRVRKLDAVVIVWIVGRGNHNPRSARILRVRKEIAGVGSGLS